MTRRILIAILAASMAFVPTTAAFADHDWIDACADGNACFWEGAWLYSPVKSSDHRDANTYGDLYTNGASVGWDTDYVDNDMNFTHAHIYRFSNYTTELFCLNPNHGPRNVSGTTTASWKGHPGSLSWCF